MPSRIDIGPEGGPFVEIDEVDGGLVLRTPTDEIDLDSNDLQNVATLFATHVDADDIDVTETATLPEANEGDPADERQIAVSPEGELLVATPTED